MEREARRLFPPGYFDSPDPTPEQRIEQERTSKRMAAKNLRDLAARGMSPRKFTREAERLEREADEL